MGETKSNKNVLQKKYKLLKLLYNIVTLFDTDTFNHDIDTKWVIIM